MHNLTGFQRDILFVASHLYNKEGEDPIGLSIKHILDDYYGQEINHGRLYPNLDQLKEWGYIDKETFDKRSNLYILTDKGQEVIDDRLDWEIEMLDEANA